jgi:hypothetical protein
MPHPHFSRFSAFPLRIPIPEFQPSNPQSGSLPIRLPERLGAGRTRAPKEEAGLGRPPLQGRKMEGRAQHAAPTETGMPAFRNSDTSRMLFA